MIVVLGGFVVYFGECYGIEVCFVGDFVDVMLLLFVLIVEGLLYSEVEVFYVVCYEFVCSVDDVLLCCICVWLMVCDVLVCVVLCVGVIF